MKKITLCFIVFLNVCILHSSAQTFQNIIGTQNSDEHGESIARNVYGNLLVAGTLTRGNIATDGKNYPLLLSLNADGTLDKAAIIENLGNVNTNAVNIAAVQTGSGKPNGYIVALNYSYDIVVIRLNNYGVILWAKNLYASNDQPVKIQPVYSPVTNYLSGFYLLANHYSTDFTLLRLSRDGNIEWQKKIEHPVSDGGYYARNILPANDGGCIVVGERKEEGNWNSSIIKFARGGALQWSRGYDFFSESDEQITSIAATSEGYVLSGISKINNLTLKIDTLGNVLWSNEYVKGSTAKAIINDENDNIIFTGSISNGIRQSAYILKISSSGNVIFGKKYPFNVQMNDITLTTDGYCAIGTVDPGLFNPPDNVYILKTDFDGNVEGNCTSSDLSVNKTPAEFIHVTEPGFKISVDTFTATNITLTASTIHNFEEDWCGATFAQLNNKTAQIQSPDAAIRNFNAYTNITAQKVDVLYNNTNVADNNKYEVILYNSNGVAVAKKPLQPHVTTTFSMVQEIPGIYMAVLLKEGKIIEKQNVVWAR